MVLATHNIDLVRTFCNRVAWMDQGEIAMIGDVEEVLEGYMAKVSYDGRCNDLRRREYQRPMRQAVILVGGRGTRLGEATAHDPETAATP